MVPRVSQAGHSFKGAALYYLNDKGKRVQNGRDPWTALRDELGDRVAHIETMNLPTDDPVMAIRHMIDTAQHADELKAQAGISNTGRKGAKPVYAYSLAWHPTESPSMAEQISAAKATLKELAIDDRQALIVAHNDTDHPHVHVIVNKVCPDTGRMAVMSNDQLKLSKWAESYEKKNGHVFCKNREANNADRDQKFVKDQSLTRQEWIEWKKGQAKPVWDQYRQDRDEARADRKAMYDALWRQKEERFALRRDEIKHLYKPIWRDVFARQRDELHTFDNGFFGRVKVALSRTDNVAGAIMGAMFGVSKMRSDLIHDHQDERRVIATQQKGRIADASKEITKAWKYDRGQLKTLHQAQDKDRLETARSTADGVWKDKTRPTPEQVVEIKKSSPDAGQDFGQSKDRRKPENQVIRSSMDAFVGEDKAKMDKVRQRKQNRLERKKRERKRPRNRGRGREMD